MCMQLTGKMESHKTTITMAMSILLTWAASYIFTSAETDCTTVTTLISSCSTFISDGSPDPFPGSPCCEAMTSLNLISNSTDNRPFVCRCLMGLINTYTPNATAIATLPGFCGVSLGFTVDPNTDCN
ncbi:Non-specific lipid-transfer protein [Melia azedarach]|uniref:Non-specific lipid-transfer protein n=1 Tax=Melia azedarach TaxID=155640 RepID=A0ACC1X563_MELAZ|nr:Non-specific lipid-transfer protein [Melia azedarach]